MKTMKKDSPLKDVCPEKKLTNHSARKTVVKKLKSSGIPKCEIKNITGHNSEQGLDDYDSGDENEQKIMSNIIDNAKPASTSRQVLHPLPSVQTQSRSASSHVYNFSHCNVTLNVASGLTRELCSTIRTQIKLCFVQLKALCYFSVGRNALLK